jgi:hypothetical protein
MFTELPDNEELEPVSVNNRLTIATTIKVGNEPPETHLTSIELNPQTTPTTKNIKDTFKGHVLYLMTLAGIEQK